jgi:hypothetical protein
MGFNIEGFPSGVAANTDANRNLNVTLPSVVAQAGYATMLFETDPGTIVGSATRRSPRVSRDFRLGVGLDTPLFADTFNGTAQNTTNWRFVFATLTATMGGGSLLLNSGSATASGNGCQFSTWPQFPVSGVGGLIYKSTWQLTAAIQTNQVFEFGLFTHNTGVVAPLDGIYFRYTDAGLIGCINFNGVETPSGALSNVALPFLSNQNYEFMIRVDNRQVDFFRDDILLFSLAIPAANGVPFMTMAQPMSFQFRNAALVTGGTTQIKVSGCALLQRDTNITKPFAEIQSGMGLHGSQGQNGGTLGTTALYSNSLAPGAGAVMTNTTAALGVGLGGQFAALPTLPANTDGIVCSYANPVGSVNQPPRQLAITGVRISSCVTTVLVGNASPVVYFYSLAYGHTNVNAGGTAETGSFATATTKAARRIPLGAESFAAAAAVGTTGSPSGVYMPFASPVLVNPGEFVAIMAKNVGVVTTSGVITFLVAFDAHWI